MNQHPKLTMLPIFSPFVRLWIHVRDYFIILDIEEQSEADNFEVEYDEFERGDRE